MAVELLQARIAQHGVLLADGMLKVDSFLNHQVDVLLLDDAGAELARAFAPYQPQRVLTAEVSGILPAVGVARTLGIPLVYARKHRTVLMPPTVYHASSVSPTKSHPVDFFVSPEYLHANERVLLIDDFLASGRTFLALADIVRQAQAQVVGVGALIEKTALAGRAALAALGVPVVALATL